MTRPCRRSWSTMHFFIGITEQIHSWYGIVLYEYVAFIVKFDIRKLSNILLFYESKQWKNLAKENSEFWETAASIVDCIQTIWTNNYRKTITDMYGNQGKNRGRDIGIIRQHMNKHSGR